MRYKFIDVLHSVRLAPLLILGALAGCAVWAYWPVLLSMAAKWSHDPQYAHAYLVPVFAMVLLWLRRQQLAGGPTAPSWWGLAMLLAGVGLRFTATYCYFEWLEAISLLPVL